MWQEILKEKENSNRRYLKAEHLHHLSLCAEPSQVMFKSPTQSFSTTDALYKIPVIRTHNPSTPATVRWRTKKAQRFDLSGALKFDPKETEKDIVINPRAYAAPIKPENFQLELFDPGNNATLGERRTTTVNVTDGGTEDMTQIE